MRYPTRPSKLELLQAAARLLEEAYGNRAAGRLDAGIPLDYIKRQIEDQPNYVEKITVTVSVPPPAVETFTV